MKCSTTIPNVTLTDDQKTDAILVHPSLFGQIFLRSESSFSNTHVLCRFYFDFKITSTVAPQASSCTIQKYNTYEHNGLKKWYWVSSIHVRNNGSVYNISKKLATEHKTQQKTHSLVTVSQCLLAKWFGCCTKYSNFICSGSNLNIQHS